MLLKLKKVLNLTTFFFIVLGSISLGIWGFFNIEILPTLMGPKISRIFYYAIGLSGLYGVHLFLEYSKILLPTCPLASQVNNERSNKD